MPARPCAVPAGRAGHERRRRAAEAGRQRRALAAGALRRWARARAGVEYDDDAVLQGTGGAPLPDEISSADDVRAVWALEVGAEGFRTARWSGGALLGYAGAAYADITSFDSHDPVLALWRDRRLDESTTLRATLDGGYAWVDDDDFYATGRAGPSLVRTWGDARRERALRAFPPRRVIRRLRRRAGRPRRARCALRAAGRTGPVCGPPGIDERRERDRDGRSSSVGVRHSIGVPRLRSTLPGGLGEHPVRVDAAHARRRAAAGTGDAAGPAESGRGDPRESGPLGRELDPTRGRHTERR